MRKLKLTNGKRAFLYILAPLFCAASILGTVFSITNNKAYAATAVTVSELTINGSGTATNGFVFKQDNLNMLYNKILNKDSGGTLAEIKSKLNGTATYLGAGTVNKMLDSSTINGGALLKVNFGGMEWQVTSVTTSNGNVIATLWLTDNNSVGDSSYSYGTFYTETNQTYSTIIYGTSYMRVVKLNAGGKYVTADKNKDGSISGNQEQDSNNQFAKFTMTSVGDNLTKYIVKPVDVLYQSQESWAGTEDTKAKYCCPNDAYGTPFTDIWNPTRNISECVDKTDYTAWKDDYLWLPSVTEIGGKYVNDKNVQSGVAAEGIWNMPNDTFRARQNAWVRSCNNGSWGGCLYVKTNGLFSSTNTNGVGGIRPALHLNLTEAEKDAVTIISPPSEGTNLKYNEKAQTYTPFGFDENTMEISGNIATIVGNYTCTVTPKAGYAWSGYSKAPVEIDFEVEKGNPNVAFGYVDSNIDSNNLYLKDYTDALPAITNVHATSTAGQLTWDDGQSAILGKNPYYWTFTPTDTNSYNIVHSHEELTFKEATITGLQVIKSQGVDIYDRFDSITYSSLEDYLKSCLIVKIEYQDGSVSTSPLGINEYKITTTDILVTSGNSEIKTINVRATNSVTNPQLNGMTGHIDVEVNKAIIEYMTVEEADDFKALSYPYTIADVKANYDVYLKWNFANRELKVADSKITVALKDGGELTAGTLAFLFTYTDGNLTESEDKTVTIAQGVYNVADITLSGNKTPVYDGQAHALTLSKAVPAGVTAVITYKKEGEATESSTAPTDAGTYTVTLTFEQTDTTNYETITKTVTETLTINKATVTGISFVGDTKPEITGTTYTLEATGVPTWVTVEYFYNGQQFTGASAAGSYLITAKFAIDAEHAKNYAAIGDKTATLTISDKPPVEGADKIVVQPTISATYTGSAVDYTAKNVPSGVTVSYEITKTGDASFSGTEVINAGEYTVTVKFVTAADKAPIADKICVITVAKANYAGVEFKNSQVVYDGEEHTLTVTGTLSDGVEATYTVKGEEGTSFTEIGDYEFTVTFSNPDPDNYNDMQPLTATLKIVAASATGITASVESGTRIDVLNTLEDLKPHLTVTINLTGNNSEAATEFELECATLRDGVHFEVGPQKITVKYGEFTTEITVTVNKATVARPVYSGKLNYTGNEIKPKSADFNGFDGAIMAFVESKLQSGVTVGSYRAVFALTDTDRYEWAAATAYSVKLYKKAITLDGEAAEPQLAANEIAVEWNVAKAVVTATKAASGLPVFKSESYKGAWGNAVSLKYYTDETCTTEVVASELETGKQYYAKVELVDAANFSLDESLSGFLDPFPYTPAAPAISSGDKALEFFKANWLWLVLAVAVLILLIVIIVLAVRLAKKKRYNDEERLMRFVPSQDMSQFMAMMQAASTGNSSVSPELYAILSGMNAKIDLLQQSTAALSQLPAPSQAKDSSEPLSEEITEIVEAAVKKALAENAAKSAGSRPADRDLASKPLVDAEAIKRAQEPIDDDRIVDWGGFYSLANEKEIEDIANSNGKKNK